MPPEATAVETPAVAAPIETTEQMVRRITREESLRFENARIKPTPGDGTSVTVPAGATLTVVNDHREDWQPNEMGRFLNSIKMVTLGQPSLADKRLFHNTATTYGSEGIGADGGFATPTIWAPRIQELLELEDEYKLIKLLDTFYTPSNNITIPIDESTPWGTTGIIATWEGEAAAGNQRKPVLAQNILRLNMLRVLVILSRELMQDGLDITGHVSRKAATAIAWKLADGVINGTGVGMPQGILNSGSLVSVAKGSGQPIATVSFGNLASMWDCMTPSMRSKAIWICNPRVQTQLRNMTMGPYSTAASVTAGTNVPAAAQVGAWERQGNQEFVFGRPVFYTEACLGLGLVGDIILVDPTSIAALMKSQGVDYAVSTEWAFDQNADAHRMQVRFDAKSSMQKVFKAPKPDYGGTTYQSLSNIVTIAARTA